MADGRQMFDYIGKRTNNDLECFNRQLNRFLTAPKPTMAKFVTFIQRVDTNMSLKAFEVRKDPEKIREKQPRG